MGKTGCKYVSKDNEFIAPVTETTVIDKTGAGDVVTGVFLAMLSNGHDSKTSLNEAVKIATKSINNYGVDHLKKECGNLNNKKLF